MTNEMDFYKTPGVMTNLVGLETALVDIPSDPQGIATVVQGLVLHPFWAEAYDVDVDVDVEAEREDELQTRAAAGMIERILEIDPRPLIERREPDNRILGNCRHFSTLTVALLRRSGVPARARCGFSSYFDPGKWVDHWVVEHWDGTQWVTLDSQIDPFQREVIGLVEDPTDLPLGLFLPAGAAWLRCQAGKEDGDRFGILDMWGRWFIEGNIARDLAALNKVEMLPWDGWGLLAREASAPGDDAYVDEVATLTVSGDHEAIRRRYQTDDGLRVPPRVTCYFTSSGPVEVEVPEIVWFALARSPFSIVPLGPKTPMRLRRAYCDAPGLTYALSSCCHPLAAKTQSLGSMSRRRSPVTGSRQPRSVGQRGMPGQ
jgi:hypothetical protein